LPLLKFQPLYVYIFVFLKHSRTHEGVQFSSQIVLLMFLCCACGLFSLQFMALLVGFNLWIGPGFIFGAST